LVTELANVLDEVRMAFVNQASDSLGCSELQSNSSLKVGEFSEHIERVLDRRIELGGAIQTFLRDLSHQNVIVELGQVVWRRWCLAILGVGNHTIESVPNFL
jgi:hypothetical protein